jgi:AcrR family transcriptional regulator
MLNKLPLATAARGRGSAATRARRTVRHHHSQATVERILECAHAVLVKYGYAGFTTRRVAHAAAIAPGNLSYHFPTKRDLVRALIARLTADILAKYASFYTDPDVRAGEEIASGIRWAFEYTVSKEGVYLFRELWAMALRDAHVRRAMNEFYDQLIEGAVRLVQRASPAIDAAQVREFVQVLMLMSEGSNVLYGTHSAPAVPFKRVVEIAIDLQRTLAPDLSGSRNTAAGKAKGKK